MDDREKIEAIREIGNLSWRQLADLLGIKTSQTFTDIRAGKHGISRALYARIMRAYPNIREEWLITGGGPMFKEDANPGVPYYDGMMPNSDTQGRSSSRGRINVESLFPGTDMVLRNNGDAMKELPQGCLLVLKKVEDVGLLVPGRNYVITTSEFRLPRRVQRGQSPSTLCLYATNDLSYADGRRVYEPMEIDVSLIKDVHTILGYIMPVSVEPQVKPQRHVETD